MTMYCLPNASFILFQYFMQAHLHFSVYFYLMHRGSFGQAACPRFELSNKLPCPLALFPGHLLSYSRNCVEFHAIYGPAANHHRSFGWRRGVPWPRLSFDLNKFAEGGPKHGMTRGFGFENEDVRNHSAFRFLSWSVLILEGPAAAGPGPRASPELPQGYFAYLLPVGIRIRSTSPALGVLSPNRCVCVGFRNGRRLCTSRFLGNASRMASSVASLVNGSLLVRT